MKKSLGAASIDYHNQLAGSEAEEYLIKERGLSKEVLRSFQIGFVGEPHPGDDIFRGMISFPFLTPTGPVAAQYRRVGDGSGARFLSRGSTKRPYNTNVFLQPHRKVFLCEGVIDTLTIADIGLPAVGLPGVDSWEKVFARAFRNRKVVVLADGDDKGQGWDFANKVLRDVDECETILFEDEDVNSFFVKHGVDSLREKIGVV